MRLCPYLLVDVLSTTLVSHSMGDKKCIISSSSVLRKALSRWSRLHLQSLAPTNLHWGRLVAHSPYVSIRN
jgi:hypothetical protein